MYSKFIVDAINNDSIDGKINSDSFEASETFPGLVFLEEKTDINQFDVSETLADLNVLKEIEDKINIYSEQLIHNKIDIADKKFKVISSRLLEDILMIYVYNSSLCDNIFSIVKRLNDFYRELYFDTKSPVARLFEGKYAVVYKLYHMRIINSEYEKIIEEESKVKRYLIKAMVDGMCNIGTDISNQTQETLTWLEENDFISIYALNGYTIRLNDKYKFKISLENQKYRNMYYLYMNSSPQKHFPRKENYKILLLNKNEKPHYE